MTVYIPRAVITAIEENARRPLGHQDPNVSVCVRIPYRGFEISIVCDSNHTKGDLFRSDLRVYKDEDNMTEELLHDRVRKGDNSLYRCDGHDVKAAFMAIDNFLRKSS